MINFIYNFSGSTLSSSNSYSQYSSTDRDTMTALNSTDLDKCTALWASVAYVAADMKLKIPS